jgi:hypothetical protein
MRWDLISGISSGFPELSQSQGQVAHVLLTRSPLGTARCCHRTDLARLACVRHAASVRPEPGSNSPSEIVELSEAHAEAGTPETSLSSGTRRPRGHRGSPSRRASSGDGRCRGSLPGHRWCWLIRLPGCSIEPSSGRSRADTRSAHTFPMMTGFRALAFHTLLSFQGASSDSLLVTPLWFPIRSRRRSVGHSISGLPGSSTERPVTPDVLGEESHRLARSRRGPALQAPTPVRAAEVATVGLPLSIPESPAVTLPAST